MTSEIQSHNLNDAAPRTLTDGAGEPRFVAKGQTCSIRRHRPQPSSEAGA